MDLIPAHSFGFLNAWLFSLAYGILSFGIMIFLPKERRKRILTFPKFESKFEKIFIGFALFIFGRGLIIYSIFIPVDFFTVRFYLGAVVYLFGMIMSVYSMRIFSQADLSKPVTYGPYKLSRHPMQTFNIIMWIGIGVMAGNWILIACALALGIISISSLKAQERFCLEKYGEEYKRYSKKVPRFLFI